MTVSASAPAKRSGVIAPYGGTLVDLMVADADRAAVKATATKTIECSDRNACDVELLCVGGFSPLRGFMHQEDYDAVVSGHRLAAGQLFSIGPTDHNFPGPHGLGATLTHLFDAIALEAF